MLKYKAQEYTYVKDLIQWNATMFNFFNMVQHSDLPRRTESNAWNKTQIKYKIHHFVIQLIFHLFLGKSTSSNQILNQLKACQHQPNNGKSNPKTLNSTPNLLLPQPLIFWHFFIMFILIKGAESVNPLRNLEDKKKTVMKYSNSS